MADWDAILIAGPTASGKSGLALELAEKTNGTVINADSMQVYDGLRILTARPEDTDLKRAPHLLYGHVKPDVLYSAARWLEDAKQALDEVRADGSVPIFVGGTGLYFKSLLNGIADVPDIDPQVRQKWRDFATEQGAEAVYTELTKRDPQIAGQFRPSDARRLVRALEVVDQTGKSLLHFQNQATSGLFGERDKIQRLVLMPDRGLLHQRINARVHAMIEEGAIEEVKLLKDRDLPREALILKAIGVAALSEHLNGETSLEKAIERIRAQTRQYAKRQYTWFRHQLGVGWKVQSN
ncbi:MAG: tRNA (adenosine(37)-N6)-dimethylallyltransferase MiaA [Pseudomonadota bacterium]